MTQDNTIFLVDGSGYIFRAYHALPPLTRPDGTPVGAVLGFTNMLMRLLKDHHAPHIAVIFDAARRNYRNDIYPEYKANRSETPEDLIPQFPLIREATAAFDIPCLELEGYEADDLIATYTRLALEQGRTVTVVSADKDLMQLIRPGVTMLDPLKNRMLNEQDVMDKFGVVPSKVVDVQALAGDSTDNVPGVSGIGVKTAAELINTYGDLESLLARAGEIKQPKRRETLLAQADMALMSKQLVRLEDEVPVTVPLGDLRVRDPDMPKLAAFLQQQGFRSLLSRIGAPAPTAATPAPVEGETSVAPPAAIKAEYVLIQDMDTLRIWLDEARHTGLVAVDTETTGLTPAKAKLIGISLCCRPGRAAYIPLGHKNAVADLLSGPVTLPKQMDMEETLTALRPVLEDPGILKIGHNIKFDLQMFAAHGIAVAPIDDTMLMSYVLDGSSQNHGMDDLALRLLHHKTISYDDVTGTGRNRITFDFVPLDKACDYAAEDADVTLRLYEVLKPRLRTERMLSVYEDIERPLIPVVAEMERCGIKVDTAVLQQLGNEFGMKLMTLESEIHALAGHPFNVASPKQLGVVLFEEMGLQGGRKTKTGDWSTAADILEDLAAENGHDILIKILEWRQLAKLKSTYTDVLQEQINPATGRIHTSFSLVGTSTGRLASSDPNLQNIPIRTEEGRKIRTAFIAEEGWSLLSVDYSQVELRLAAEMAGIAALKQAFKDGTDIHTLTASQVFGIPLDQVSPEVRRQAKAVNFGIIYGISGFGLAKQLGCPPGEAAQFIRAYLARFGELQDYMDRTKDEARKNGYVRTLYGRKCYIDGIADKNPARRQGAERQAINAPLQGTAADIMKKAMVRIGPALIEAGLNARLLLQVHDELVLEVPDRELEQTATLVKSVMESTAQTDVPLIAEAGWAANWSAAH